MILSASTSFENSEPLSSPLSCVIANIVYHLVFSVYDVHDSCHDVEF